MFEFLYLYKVKETDINKKNNCCRTIIRLNNTLSRLFFQIVSYMLIFLILQQYFNTTNFKLLLFLFEQFISL